MILTRLMGLLSFLGVEGSFEVARDDQGIANWVAAGGRSGLDLSGWTFAGYRQTELAVRRKSTGILRCSSLITSSPCCRA